MSALQVMKSSGKEAQGYELTGLFFTSEERAFVEVKLNNGYKLLMYRSSEEGSGTDSRGERVPFPGWFIKHSDASDQHQDIKIEKYRVPLFQRIAQDLKTREKVFFPDFITGIHNDVIAHPSKTGITTTVASGANTLKRFLEHQNSSCSYTHGKSTFQQALLELKNGQKHGHWCWYIFPQVAGLGINPSQACLDFEIRNRNEAQEYWSHPTLQARLLACCNAVNQHAGRPIEDILGGGRMGQIDALKLHTCATLFYQVSGGHPVFQQVLHNFYHDSPHQQTLQVLSTWQPLNLT